MLPELSLLPILLQPSLQYTSYSLQAVRVHLIGRILCSMPIRVVDVDDVYCNKALLEKR